MLDAIERLPAPADVLVVVRFGEPITLERIGDALGLSTVQERSDEQAAEGVAALLAG
jgi:hypothetical protein